MSRRSDIAARVQGLYGIADSADNRDPVRLAAHYLQGGCRLLQLRCKDWGYDERVRAGRAIRNLCHSVGAVFLMNDDVEAAVACGADGLHIGQTDISDDVARSRLGPDRILGRSMNDPEQMSTPGDADYLAFGPVFPTRHLSHPKTIQGLEHLQLARNLTQLPLVAIGGITAQRLPLVRATGVDAWAVITAVAAASDPTAATRALLGPQTPSR